MASGNDDPDADDGDILSPEELDISTDEHVAEIDDGRYVVSPNEPIDDLPGHASADGSQDQSTLPGESGTVPDRGAGTTRDDDGRDTSKEIGSSAGARDVIPTAGGDPDPSGTAGPVAERDVRRWLAAQFDESDSRYGFDVTATFDGTVQQRQMVSNDVVTIFESLVLWYAQQIDSTTPVEEVLGILLMEANVPVRYPSASLQRTLESTDLTPEDSIADLVEVVGDEGFRI